MLIKRKSQMKILSILTLLAVLESEVQGFAPVIRSPPSQRTVPSTDVDSHSSHARSTTTPPSSCPSSLQTMAVIRDRRKRLAFVSLGSSSTSSSTSSTAVTELPDSLQDAAIRAAQASASFMEVAGPMARCRVDFDTTIGDETYTMLKSTTEFMQGLVTALSKLTIPGVEERYMDDQMRVVQASGELKQLEQQAQAAAAPSEDALVEGNASADDDDDASMMQQEQREEELIQIIQNGGRTKEAWDGPIVRVYFPDEGSAALARRDWAGKHVPACVQFSSCGGVQQHSVDRDQVVFFYCPRASESDSVEAILARHETLSSDLKLTVFVNPNLVDMGVTGFGLAGRMLRERLIDPLQYTYYLRTLSWGALTREWPNAYSVWQEDEGEVGGYRFIQTLDRLPSNPEVEEIYDRENGGRSDADGGGPGVLNQLGDFINGMMRL